MRSLVVAIGLLAFTASADAKPKKRVAKIEKKSTKKPKKSERQAKKKKRIALGGKKSERFVLRAPKDDQSVGACWRGRLQNPVQLRDGEGWYLRRPWRAYGATNTIELVERVLVDMTQRGFTEVHDIAIGDISAPHGGRISEHSSHQSGRDIDVGLIFTKKPAAYPASFVVGNADNLDLEATFVLVEEFARTNQDAEGVHMIFLDFDVQSLLYHWGLENGEDPDYLAKLFQYPHGRSTSMGIVRHEPYHGDHLHVRFRCPANDSACR